MKFALFLADAGEGADRRVVARKRGRQPAQAQVDLINLRNTLHTQALAQRASMATLRTDAQDARRKAEAIRNLQGVVSDIELKQQLDRADELENRTRIEEQKLGVMQGS